MTFLCRFQSSNRQNNPDRNCRRYTPHPSRFLYNKRTIWTISRELLCLPGYVTAVKKHRRSAGKEDQLCNMSSLFVWCCLVAAGLQLVRSQTNTPGTALSAAYVGCYADRNPDSGVRDLPDHTDFMTTNTPEVCIQNCRAKKFPYAAVQYGYACFCGSSYGRYGPSTGCNVTPCTGDSSLKCGGPVANAVYKTGIEYVGCYADRNPDSGPRDLPDNTAFMTTNTPEVCIKNCIAKNFQYAAVQYGYECFCGSSYGRYGPSTSCDMSPCTGSSSLKCGGPVANAVYKTGIV